MGQANKKKSVQRARSGRAQKRNTAPVLVLIVAVSIALAFVIAIVAGGSDSNEGASGPDYQPVTVEGSALPSLEEGQPDTAIGTRAPSIRGLSFDGTTVAVTPGDGKNHMVVFLAHWCPHCNAEIPRLIDWKNQGMVPDGLIVTGISTAVANDRPNYPPSRWVKVKGWPWETMADSENMDAAAAYGVAGYPFFALVDGDGIVRYRFSGEIEIDQLNQVISEAFAN